MSTQRHYPIDNNTTMLQGCMVKEHGFDIPLWQNCKKWLFKPNFVFMEIRNVSFQSYCHIKNIATQHTHQKFYQDCSYFPTHESLQLDIACPILTLEYNRIWLTTIKQRCYLRLSLKMTELLTDSEKNHVSIERAVISTKYTASRGSIALLTPHICCWLKCSYITIHDLS